MAASPDAGPKDEFEALSGTGVGSPARDGPDGNGCGEHDIGSKQGNLSLRLKTALVIGPLAFVVFVIGSPLLQPFLWLVGGLMALEWRQMSGGSWHCPFGLTLLFSVFLVLGLGMAGWLMPAWLVLGGLTVLIALAAWRFEPQNRLWLSSGVLVIGGAVLALLWLRFSVAMGRETVIWLMLVVWTTDIGAFFAGRLVGGPRLAPDVSPGKTWAGLAGGATGAALVGLLFLLAGSAGLLKGQPSLYLPVYSGLLALVAQAGDLVESAAKRHYGVKDSSSLVPGHGGVLDRVDGLLAAIPVVALATLLSGRSPLEWP